jgi:hypothetical protein
LTDLAATGQLDLLRRLYGQWHIAQGVWEELNPEGQRRPIRRRKRDDGRRRSALRRPIAADPTFELREALATIFHTGDEGEEGSRGAG